MRKIATLGLAGILTLTGCGGDSADNKPAEPAPQATQTAQWGYQRIIDGEDDHEYQERIVQLPFADGGHREERIYVDTAGANALDQLMLRIEEQNGGRLSINQYSQILRVIAEDTNTDGNGREFGDQPVITELVTQYQNPEQYGALLGDLYERGILETRTADPWRD